MTIRQLLAFDAATCAGAGAMLLALSGPIAGLTDLPQNLLFIAGGLLVPIALLMAALAAMRSPPTAGIYAIVAINAAWIAATFAVVFLAGPNALGIAALVAQAAVIGVLSWAEARQGASGAHDAGVSFRAS